jgi:hypothetical protein
MSIHPTEQLTIVSAAGYCHMVGMDRIPFGLCFPLLIYKLSKSVAICLNPLHDPYVGKINPALQECLVSSLLPPQLPMTWLCSKSHHNNEPHCILLVTKHTRMILIGLSHLFLYLHFFVVESSDIYLSVSKDASLHLKMHPALKGPFRYACFV